MEKNKAEYEVNMFQITYFEISSFQIPAIVLLRQ